MIVKHPRMIIKRHEYFINYRYVGDVLFIHGVSLLPPPATVHPRGSCSSSLHRLLFNHPSTGYCSSSPPRGPVHPPPTDSIGVLFIQRQRPLLPWGPVHPTPIGNCSSNPQQRSLFIKRQRFDQLQLAAVAKESLDQVQLTARDRSIARV